MVGVSIIVAAYNIEKYIYRCLKTLVNQTYNNIEIIIVNDGSTDSTLEKIQEFAKKDKRIKIVNKKNEGLLEARRSGLLESTKEYILFMDGDDWLEYTAIEILIKHAILHKLDVVYYNFYLAYSDKYIENVIDDTSVMIGEEFLFSVLIGKVLPAIWAKLIKKEFLEKNNIDLPKGFTYGEDLAMTVSIGCAMPRVGIVNKPLIYYLQREGSITNRGFTKQVFEIETALEYIIEKLKDNNLYEKYKKEVDYLIYRHMFASKILTCKNCNIYHKEFYKNFVKKKIEIKGNKYYESYIKSQSKSIRFKDFLFRLNYSLGRSVVNCIYKINLLLDRKNFYFYNK